jgi:hypothetical protein
MTHGNCTYTRLIYASPLYGNQRVEESNLAAWVFETPPKGTLLAVRDSAKLRAIQSLQPLHVVTECANLQSHCYIHWWDLQGLYTAFSLEPTFQYLFFS